MSSYEERMISKSDILTMIDKVTEPDVMTKAEALEFLEVLVSDIESRMECLKEEMANAGERGKPALWRDDVAKLPKLRAKSASRARSHEQVTTRFKTPRAKK